jgi:hypothetical protein
VGTNPSLQPAIEHLYATFAIYVLSDDTNACSCCHAPQDEKRIHQKPLRNLTSKDLYQYATDALFVWGDADDFKHFLPRIFELVIAIEADFVDQEVVFNKLFLAEWRYWPPAEQASIEQYFDALWSFVINAEPRELHGSEIEHLLCAIAQAVSDLSPYLNSWISAATDNARLNLARFIAETKFAGGRPRALGYWETRAEAFSELMAWVRSDVVKREMSAIAADFPQYEFVERAFILLP